MKFIKGSIRVMATVLAMNGSLAFATDVRATQLPNQYVAGSDQAHFQIDPSGLGRSDRGVNPLCVGSYYNWGRGMDGWGYCYHFACNGAVLNNGQPVSNYSCEATRPSYVNWGRGQNGWGYCYQYTAQGVAMNYGQPVSNYRCEQWYPSHYSWGRANNGYTYCYQFSPSGIPLNDGQPVSEYLCR